MPWTPSDLPTLDGVRALVTGANSGIGWHTVAALARRGARVTLACRNTGAGDAAAQRIRHGVPGADLEVRHLDLSSLESVARLAGEWEGPLDLLVNNAGVMTPPTWQGTSDGFELQFGTNHLGHYALTAGLLPALLSAPAPRVVTVSSIRHHWGTEAVLEGNPAETYRPGPAYGNSKLANLLFGAELQRRAASRAPHLTSTMAHPGVSATGLVTDTQGMGANPVIRALAPAALRLAFQSAAAGANPSLYAATAATPGSYTGPQWLGETRGPIGPARLSAFAQDEALAAKLWDRSEELTGVSWGWES